MPASETKTTPMQMGAEPGVPFDAGVLVSWWRLAGVDTLAHTQAESWLKAPLADEPPVARQPARHLPAKLGRERLPAQSGGERLPAKPGEAFDTLASLADLEAVVRATFPRAPLADGNPQSGVMLIGAGPAADDFTTGKPFSGPAGRLLDNMLRAIGLDRTSSYLALAAPRWNRPTPPPPDAYAADAALIRAQIRLAAPRIVLLLGSGAVESLTGNRTPIGRLRGQWLTIDQIPALATFNPGYLLRRPEDKRLAWADLLAFRQRLSQ